MKNIFYLFLMVSVTFFACDPLDETYDELDKTAVDPTSVQVLEITLTEDDYALLEDEDIEDSFESDDQAKEMIPVILEKLYPQLGNGSSITVTYRLSSGGIGSLTEYTGADAYTITSDDYYSIDSMVGDAGFFNNTVKAGNHIPQILKTEIQDPADEQYLAVSYKFADVEYEDITGVVLHSESFDATLGDYDTTSVVGDQKWIHSTYSGDGFAKMSGYSSGNKPNEDWLITPAIDLTSQVDVVLKFKQTCPFMKTGVFGEDIAVKISTDSVTWTNLEVDKWPTGDDYDYDFVDSEVSLKDYEGEVIYIAFYYTSTTDFAPTWEVSDVLIEAGEIIPTNQVNTFYQYVDSVATWYPLNNDKLYYLSSDDYDLMGAPGKYDNFSNSVRPEDYIPQFLKMKYPFAQEGDEMVIIYRYYSGSTYTSGNYYTYENGEWVASSSTLQFGKEEGVWVPDNTIRYTFTATDYSDVGKNTALGTEASRGNLNSFGNFNINSGYWTQEDILKAIGFILKKHFPNSEVGQKYLVTYNTYPAGDLEMHVILNADGEYELVK